MLDCDVYSLHVAFFESAFVYKIILLVKDSISKCVISIGAWDVIVQVAS